MNGSGQTLSPLEDYAPEGFPSGCQQGEGGLGLTLQTLRLVAGSGTFNRTMDLCRNANFVSTLTACILCFANGGCADLMHTLFHLLDIPPPRDCKCLVLHSTLTLQPATSNTLCAKIGVSAICRLSTLFVSEK